MTTENQHHEKMPRRTFVGTSLRALGAVGLCGIAGKLAIGGGQKEELLWQIDPDKCMACGNCQDYCVLEQSAVKAVNCFARCGYCDECSGYFPTTGHARDTGVENHLCPTGAVVRKFVEEKGSQRHFEYTIDEDLCIGCGKCVLGCRLMNGSLYLQVRHDRCQNCNECAIAVACPTQALHRVPASSPNLLGKVAKEAEKALKHQRAETGKKTGNMPAAGAGDV